MVVKQTSFPVVEREVKQRQRQSQISVAPTAIHQRHLSQGYIIFPGLSIDRPETGDTEIKAYFALDTGDLSIWDGSNWLSVTLT